MPLFYVVFALIVVGIIAWIINATYFPAAESVRSIINVVLSLMVVGMALWLINTYVPMAKSIKAILNFVVVIATCVRILQVLGLWSGAVRLWSDFTNHFSR